MGYDARKILYETGGGCPQTMMTGYDDATSSFNTVRVDQNGHFHQDQYVWDSSGLQWIPATSSGGAASLVGVKNVAGTQINPATEDTLVKLNGFSLPVFNAISFDYTGTDLTTITYKQGASTVAVLSLTYNSGQVSTITRTT